VFLPERSSPKSLIAAAHIDQHARLRNIISRALDGCSYEASRQEEPRMLVIEARRPDGRSVGVRFRGVRSSDTDKTPEPGAMMKLRGVGNEKLSISQLFIPRVLRQGSLPASRVRIDAGAAHMEVVCEDAEWWESS
jgi:hypothetical protein